jgi:hypothetical protein
VSSILSIVQRLEKDLRVEVVHPKKLKTAVGRLGTEVVALIATSYKSAGCQPNGKVPSSWISYC